MSGSGCSKLSFHLILFCNPCVDNIIRGLTKAVFNWDVNPGENPVYAPGKSFNALPFTKVTRSLLLHYVLL